jgi:hypothetical protein
MQVAALSARGGGGRQDRRVTMGQIRAEGLGQSGQAEWVQVRGSGSAVAVISLSLKGGMGDMTGGVPN